LQQATFGSFSLSLSLSLSFVFFPNFFPSSEKKKKKKEPCFFSSSQHTVSSRFNWPSGRNDAVFPSADIVFQKNFLSNKQKRLFQKKKKKNFFSLLKKKKKKKKIELLPSPFFEK
jgi:hypothetical protein